MYAINYCSIRLSDRGKTFFTIGVNMDDSLDNITRDFIIDNTGGDHTVDIYDQWCEVSNILEYDHVSANAFIMSSLGNHEPAVIVNKIMTGFAVAAHSQAANAGITLNPQLNYKQLLMWVNTMHQIAHQVDYTDIKGMLYADMPDTDKIQKVFELLGPGVDPDYENMILAVESSTVDGFKELIQEIQAEPEYTKNKQEGIQIKIAEYTKLKEKTQGSIFSDKFATMPSCYGMDIDTYTTAMKDNMDFYLDPENWDEFFIDIWGCLILSNVPVEKYKDHLTAAVYEFFDSETVRPRVLAKMGVAIARLSA